MASPPAHGSGVRARSAFPHLGRSERRSWTLIALCAVLPARSQAQETPDRNDPALVNGLGVLAALEIAGASTFREEAIVQALRWSPRYLLASHPRSDLSDYLTFLEDGIRSGYLSGGFRDAEVKASADGSRGRVVVQVKEGRRWKAGTVHVEGSRALSGSAIVERLTRSWTTRKDDGGEETKGPLWEEGSPAPFDSIFFRSAKRHVEALYAEAGHLSARVDVAVKAGDDPAAALLVKVLEEGDSYTLGDLRFRGSFSDPEEDVRRLGGITESLRLDQGSLEGLKARLESTGRYLKVKVEPPTLRDGGKADLRITLYQADFAPPLDEPASEARKVLSRAAAWLGEPDRWGVDVSLRAESGQGLQSGHDFAGALEMLLGKDGLAAILRVGSGSSPLRGTLGLCLQRGEGLLVATPLRIRARFTTAGSVRFIGSVNVAPADPEKPAR
ncbi:MAG TPA: hypothetical protein VMT52_13705, partial [Planctomycetota bacterium]|nr:hypothetical protein [Planctomycetota bacterium]